MAESKIKSSYALKLIKFREVTYSEILTVIYCDKTPEANSFAFISNVFEVSVLI